jgi:PAS domain S-box-containing protein
MIGRYLANSPRTQRGADARRLHYPPTSDGARPRKGRRVLEQLHDLVGGRWQAVFHNTLDAILLIDDATCLVEANLGACRLLGYSREELLKLDILAIAPLESEAETDSQWRQLISQGKLHRETVVRCKDGTLREVEYKAVANALPNLHLSVFHDITERKRAERKLVRYARRLEAMGDIEGAILAARSSREIAQAIVSHVHRLVHCKLACIFIFDHDGRTVSTFPTRAATQRLLSPGTQHPIEFFGELADLRQGRTRVVDHLGMDSNRAPLAEVLLQEGVRSYIAFPILSDNELVAALVLGGKQPSEVAPERMTLAGQVAQHFAVALQGARLLEEVRRGRHRLTQLSRQLLKTQEIERRNIARELHDVIGQALAVTKVNLEVLKQATLNQPSKNLVHETVSMIDEALEQARNLSLDLRPRLLDDFGLACAMGAYLDRQAQRSGFVANCTFQPLENRLSLEIETTCFRVLQEAVTNLVRHAQASQLFVDLREVEGNLELLIRDDGIGFDVALAHERALRGQSMGLLGMQERVALLGGEIEITSALGQGTTIRVSFPISDRDPPAVLD